MFGKYALSPFLIGATLVPPVKAQSFTGIAPISLTCTGQGEKPENQTSHSYQWDCHRDRYRSREESRLGTKDYQASVTVQIVGEGGRIRLPAVMIPPIHSGGGSQGWWQLRDVIVGDDEIRGSYKLNGFNSADVRIDRRSGDIRIKTLLGDFSGSCRRFDPNERQC